MKAKEFDRKFDEGGDVIRYLDLSKIRKPAQEQKRGIAVVIASAADGYLFPGRQQALPQAHRPEIGLPHRAIPYFQAIKRQGIEIQRETTA